MKLISDVLRLSPTDLANYAACPHLTTLDIAVAKGELKADAAVSGVTEALRRRGELHETAYIAHLNSQGLTLTDLRESALDDSGQAATVAAMERGVEVIVQAPLLQQGWAGRADVLRRVETPSTLGAWSYEPLDTKLARDTRGSAILQLCAYGAVLAAFQGVTPEFLHVVSPGQPFTTHTYRYADYGAYYRLVRARLEQRITSNVANTYPEPVVHCEICRWSAYCDARRRQDDHLSLVANIRRLQIEQLRAWGIDTLAALGTTPVPFAKKPDRGSADALLRSREQARVQLAGRTTGSPVHECLPIVKAAGLCRLPEPSKGDIFFDIEGDPFVPDAGREYLFGYAYQDSSGTLMYDDAWGLTAEDEKKAFESFVDFVLKRWKDHPDLHIYHYAPYEPSALKRLMGRFGAREDDVDRMLRAELFVDLYAVVRQGVRASVERYSIKALEPFYGYVRDVPLAEAGQHLRAMDMALEFNETDVLPKETFEVVRRYNRDDCVSAARLRDWLESLRANAIKSGQYAPRPAVEPPKPNEKLKAREAQVRELMERLARDIPVDVAEQSSEQQARWLLAQLLEFHRREDKAAWWDYYRLAELPAEEYADEPSALDGLEFVKSVGGTKKCPVHRYTFPPQELKLSRAEVFYSRDAELGTVDAFDLDSRTIDIKKREKAVSVHPPRMFFFDYVRPRPLPETLFDIGEWVANNRIDGDGQYRAARDLLLNQPPRLRNGEAWIIDGESPVARARRTPENPRKVLSFGANPNRWR